MPSSLPFFSIVIPTYNRAHLIGKTLQSIREQELKDFEVLVVDDGSTDATEEVVKAFTDDRIQYFRKENAERGAARNFGAMRAKGKYINFFDSDDIMYSHHLSTALSFVMDNGECEFFHLGYDHKMPDGTLLGVTDKIDNSVREVVLFDNILSCNGVFVRNDIARNNPFREERVLASSEDWELWIRLMCRYKLLYSNTITSTIIGHDLRSIRSIAAEKVIARDLFLIKCLESDPDVMKVYGERFKRFIAERYTFFMLCLAENKKRKEVLIWTLRAMNMWSRIAFTRRFLASLKKIVI